VLSWIAVRTCWPSDNPQRQDPSAVCHRPGTHPPGSQRPLPPCDLLVQELLVAKRDLRLPQFLKQLGRYEALLIDDIGYVQHCARRWSPLRPAGLPIRTRQCPADQQPPVLTLEQIFKDPMTTAAAIDRLVHHSVVLELNIPAIAWNTPRAAHGHRNQRRPRRPEQLTTDNILRRPDVTS